ncbi:MAG TPA: tripartite tricarboxylate transporter substrate binding protein [Syntrophorhabdaceae bacterium]|nr:tripartite tricarboxylate transporter substrate binding protein [Syntrophorhabdaceae bacterium]
MSIRKLFLLATFCVAALVAAGFFSDRACAQEKYPTRAIDIIVPTGPGGSTDLTTRIIAAELKKLWGVPVNVVNKTGGNMVPALLEVLDSEPDGYTMFADNISASSAIPLTAPKELLPKLESRTYISLTTTVPFLLFVPASSPVKSLKDLEAEIKKDPGAFTWPSGGGAAAADVLVRQFAKLIGVDVNKTKPVPAQSGAQMLTLSGSGSIKLLTFGATMGVPNTQAGFIRPIVTLYRTRLPEFPDVSTSAEQGYPTMVYHYWSGISGPPKLPASIAQKWEKTLAEVLKNPAVLAELKKIGNLAFYHNAADTKKYVAQETDSMAKIFK